MFELRARAHRNLLRPDIRILRTPIQADAQRPTMQMEAIRYSIHLLRIECNTNNVLLHVWIILRIPSSLFHRMIQSLYTQKTTLTKKRCEQLDGSHDNKSSNDKFQRNKLPTIIAFILQCLCLQNTFTNTHAYSPTNDALRRWHHRVPYKHTHKCQQNRRPSAARRSSGDNRRATQPMTHTTHRCVRNIAGKRVGTEQCCVSTSTTFVYKSVLSTRSTVYFNIRVRVEDKIFEPNSNLLFSRSFSDWYTESITKHEYSVCEIHK